MSVCMTWHYERAGEFSVTVRRSVMLGPRLSQQAQAGGGGHAETTLPFCLSLTQDNLCAR